MVNVLLTLDMVKDIQSYDEVLFIAADYVGYSSNVQLSHHHPSEDHRRRLTEV